MSTGKTAVVLGARGGMGKQIVFRLLEKPTSEISEIRAVVRGDVSEIDPTNLFKTDNDKIDLTNEKRLQLLSGDVTQVDSLKPIFSGAHYIFNAVSGSHSRDETTVALVDRDSVDWTAKLAKEVCNDTLERYVLVSSQFVHPSNRWAPVRIMLNTVVTGVLSKKGVMDYKWEAEQLLHKSGVPYTIVRPGHLQDGGDIAGVGPKMVVAQTNADLKDLKGGAAPRADVAAVCVAAASCEKAKNTTFETGGVKEEKAEEIGEGLFDDLVVNFCME